MDTENSKNTNYITVPEMYNRRQLNALYREIPLKDTTSRALRKYFCAMANLYGIVSLKKAYEIICEQSPKLVTKDEFTAFAEIARHECESYYILGKDEIFSDGKIKSPLERQIIFASIFDENDELYFETSELQRGKPFYVPKKSELLCYSDAYYYEETQYTEAMKSFLKRAFKLNEIQEVTVFDMIMHTLRCLNGGMSEIMGVFDEMDLEFKKESDFQKFFELFQDLNNNTRMQCNCGYTPSEISKIYSRSESQPTSLTLGPGIRKGVLDGDLDIDDMRSAFMEMDMPNEALRFSVLKELAKLETELKSKKGEKNENPEKPKKVGRNDPCPCGSGKKYKKCCGRA